MDKAPICILLVEDNPADVHLVEIALGEMRSAAKLYVVQDGFEALDFLRRQPPFSAAPRPDLVFLDLNLPRLGGHQVLRERRDDPALRETPVIVLTTSDAASDIHIAYELGANSYVIKPASFEAFLETMAAIERFWFRTACLPGREWHG